MDIVTITDHDAIDGWRELRDAYPDAKDILPGEEVSCRLPDGHVEVHFGVYGITEQLHREIQPLRRNVYDVAALYVPVDMQIEKVEAGREVRRHMVLLRPRTAELQRPKSYLEFRNDEPLRQQIANRGNLQVIRDAGTSAVTLAVTSSPPADVVVATSSILVRERVVTVHVVSVLQSNEDRTWVIEATMRWIESINSANQ